MKARLNVHQLGKKTNFQRVKHQLFTCQAPIVLSLPQTSKQLDIAGNTSNFQYAFIVVNSLRSG